MNMGLAHLKLIYTTKSNNLCPFIFIIRQDLWGGLDRNGSGEAKLDLKNRGLCLVPISGTPQACRENAGSDYLTPMYRGCLYR
mgnify:CR=1 FL=1